MANHQVPLPEAQIDEAQRATPPHWVSGTADLEGSRDWMAGPFDLSSYVSQIPSGSFYSDLMDVGANDPRPPTPREDHDIEIGECSNVTARNDEVKASEVKKHIEIGECSNVAATNDEVKAPVQASEVKKEIENAEGCSSVIDGKLKMPSNEMHDATKVKELRPLMSGVTLTVKVVSIKIVSRKGRAGGPRSHMQVAECLVGDETGMIIFRARNDQVDLMKEGSTVALRNAKIDMFKGSMRLVVEKSGRVEVAEPASFTVMENNNLSLIEFERVSVT